MAMVMDQQQQQQQQQQQELQQQPQQQVYKHYCRVCKKGFGCGRALGGHMRAHGINEDTVVAHDDPDVDEPSGCGADWDDKLSSPPTKRMYALRTNPNRLKTCRVCENCGKEFFSWKSFLEHGKCSSDDEDEDDDYFASPQRSDADEDLAGHAGCAGWSKGKRSRRAKMIGCGSGGNAPVTPPNCPSREEEDLANCLVMLSASRVEPMVIVEAEESCASASKEEPHDHRRQTMFTFAPVVALEKFKAPASAAAPSAPRGMFECKACKKVFTSHQALGGHRASHKKVKGCFAAKLAESDEASPDDDTSARDNASTSTETASMVAMSMAIVPFDNPAPLSVAPLRKKSRVHECSICHRVFSSGQALGGHKRCHWITSNLPDPAFKLLPVPDHATVLQRQLTLARSFESLDPVLDLNLPASAAAADDAAVVPQDVGSPLRLDVPAAILLQHLVEHSNKNKSKDVASGSSNNNNIINNDATSSKKDKNINEGSNVNNNNNNNGDDDNNTTNNNMDDEVESKVKIAKLSDLKDINMGGESSPWLQVGIGPSANESSTDP